MPSAKFPSVASHNPRLAASLRLIAAKGRAGFYEGKIADAIVATSREKGGTMTLADLKEFTPEWVEPISTTYRGWTVYEMPPNGQGIAALTMLNLMENFPLEKFDALSTDASVRSTPAIKSSVARSTSARRSR